MGNRHGQPGPLAYKLDTLVINRKIDEAGRPTPRILALGSLHEIALELGLDRNTAAVRKALLQNVGAIINAKITYKAVDKTERTLEAVFSRYSVVFTGEQLPDGHRADCVYLLLNEPYAEVIDAATRRPQDYEYLRDLPPAPQRFYEIISYQMLPAIRYSQRAKLPYSEFCLYSTMTRYFEFERVKKQMYKIHLPHVRAGYLAKIEYEATVDAEGQPDWNMFYQPGETARFQQQVFDLGPAAQKKAPDRKSFESKAAVKKAFVKPENTKPENPKAETVVQLSLQAFSLDAKDADPVPVALNPPIPAAPSRALVEAVEENGAEKNGAQELVKEFYCQRYGRTQDPTDREIVEAQTFLSEGNGWAKHLVAFAARQGKDKNSFPNDFGGVKKLVSQARASFEVRKNVVLKAQHKDARQSHQVAHTGAYHTFLGELLGGRLKTSLPEAFSAFSAEEEKTYRFHQSRAEKSAVSARLAENYYSEENRVKRLLKFIEENPKSGLPNFWQWDTSFNPTPFRDERA